MLLKAERDVWQQLAAFFQALNYICGTFIGSDGRRYEYHQPFKHARYCIEFAEMNT